MEHQIKFYSGSPSRQAMCRRSRVSVAKWVNGIALHFATRKYAERVLAKIMASDSEECISSGDPAFSSMIGITAEDMRVLLQFQEELIHRCQKWSN